MVTIPEVLKGLAVKTYKFFAPAVSSTSTAVDESVVIELARQSGQGIKAVTNGLGECVGYTASNIAVSNGESTAVGTVIDFASRQVVATEELLASEAVAGNATVAVGATTTEITATTTTTAMLGTTVASVGACVVAAIGGYNLGKTVGDYLAEHYPDFWVNTCGKALYDAGCTIGKDVNAVITYMNPDGNTMIPKKTVAVIKNELVKVGAISNESSVSTPHTYTYTRDNIDENGKYSGDVYQGSISAQVVWYINTAYGGASIDNVDINGNTSVSSESIAYSSTANGQTSTGTFNNTSISMYCGIKPSNYQQLNWSFSTIIFKDKTSAVNYLKGAALQKTNLYYIPSNYYFPPDPVTVPTPKIRPGDAPSTDDDSQAIPVPGLVPATDPDAVPTPRLDPVTPTDSVADNPNPFPKPLPQHVPDLPDQFNNKPDKPILPVNPTMIASALSRVYNPTQAQLDALGQYMWSSSRLDDLLKLFQNPADGIISLHAIYGTPSVGGSAEIKLGYLSTGVSAQVVTSQFVIINCGTISVSELFNNATDYAPYTSIQIYLPFIGIQGLNPFDIIGSSITCTYKIDVYTGACIAQLNVERSDLNGVIYEFAGNCSYQIPLTSGNYIQALANVIGGAVGGALIGNAAGAALGAGRALLHSNADISRSGNLSANAGILGNRKPYFIITRSIPKDAVNYSNFYGFPSNKTVYLSECSGYTRVKDIILHTSATQEERDEIMKLLKTGIYI